MRKTITAIVATAGIAAAALAVPKSAEARCIGCWVRARRSTARCNRRRVTSPAYGGYGYGYRAYSYGYGYPSYSYGYPAYGYAPYAYAPGYYAYAPRRAYARRYYRY